MSRRRKKVSKKSASNLFLNPEWEDVQNAIEEDERMPINLPKEVTGKSNVPSTPGYFSTGNNNWSANKCTHKGDKVIFEHNGKQLFAAKGMDLNEYSGNWELIIDLATNIRKQEPVLREITSKRMMEELAKYTGRYKEVPSEVLGITWPDYGVPALKPDFWYKLWELLPATTVMACVGGHGRTGTCMAALMITAGIDYYTAVNDVRTIHCDNAIESLVQEQYLHGLWIHHLNRTRAQAEADGDVAMVGWCDDELVYARDHVPSSFSSFGEKPPSQQVTVQKGEVPQKPSEGTSGNYQGQGWKLEGNVLYEEKCGQDCADSFTMMGCRNPNHKVWKEWEPDNQSMKFPG